ncbi:MAG: hypothetical protein QG583_308 [Patescibacteria group bacterium]|nr:hypothetical protein [Patescibacteria group bacterium]
MSKDEHQKIQHLRDLQNNYRTQFSILKKAKENLLKLFRKKLEEKKIEEIKNSL